MSVKRKLARSLKKIVYGHKADTETYIRYLRKIGVSVGDNIEIFSLRETVIDTTSPHLLTIGSNISMTGPVCILVHDYSVCVTKMLFDGYITGKQRPTTIDNNVFLGWGCCILPGTHVHENTIIGAYSVVSGDLEANSVYAGNPGIKVSTIEDYYKRRRKSQLDEASMIYRSYYNRYGRKPPEELFHEYFFLFSGGIDCQLNPAFEVKMSDHGNYNDSLTAWRNNVPQFESYEAFCKYMDIHK